MASRRDSRAGAGEVPNPCPYCGRPNRTPGWLAWHIRHEHQGMLVTVEVSRTRAEERREANLQDYLRQRARTESMTPEGESWRPVSWVKEPRAEVEGG